MQFSRKWKNQLRLNNMKFNVIKVTTENELNKAIKYHKLEGTFFGILYHSLWDKWSKDLVEKVELNHEDNEANPTLYLVDTFNLPHSTVIYKDNQGNNISKVPALVVVKDKSVSVTDYLPDIYYGLGI